MSAKKSPNHDALRRAREKAERIYGNREYITGIDVGYRWTDGAPTDELCVRLHVEKKLPVSALETAEIFPSEIDGIPIDVYEGIYKIERTTMAHEHQSRQEVLQGGISVSHPTITAGTLGLFAADKVTGRVGILSNWHVLVGPEGKVSDPILQPGDVDGGRLGRDEIAIVQRSILERAGDAAFAELTGARGWALSTLGLAGLPTQVRNSRLGETLQKSGRTTGLTSGRVDGEGMYRVNYEIRPKVFQKISISGFKIVPKELGNPNNTEISLPGDSGSTWISQNGNDAVGLHFAGETQGDARAEFGLACNLESVFEKLGLRLANTTDLISPTKALTQLSTPDGQLQTFSLNDILAAYEAGRAAEKSSFSGIARIETASRTKFKTLVEIWREFRIFFNYIRASPQSFDPETKVSTLIPDIQERSALGGGINRFPQYEADGIKVNASEIFQQSTMGEVVDRIKDAYRAAGWTIVGETS